MYKLLLALVAVLGSAMQALAAGGIDVSTVTVDTAPVFTVFLVVVTALAGMWAIRKIIKLLNKS